MCANCGIPAGMKQKQLLTYMLRSIVAIGSYLPAKDPIPMNKTSVIVSSVMPGPSMAILWEMLARTSLTVWDFSTISAKDEARLMLHSRRVNGNKWLQWGYINIMLKPTLTAPTHISSTEVLLVQNSVIALKKPNTITINTRIVQKTTMDFLLVHSRDSHELICTRAKQPTTNVIIVLVSCEIWNK